jgi:hypothetical protein
LRALSLSIAASSVKIFKNAFFKQQLIVSI